jgi:hypothetical protein
MLHRGTVLVVGLLLLHVLSTAVRRWRVRVGGMRPIAGPRSGVSCRVAGRRVGARRRRAIRRAP